MAKNVQAEFVRVRNIQASSILQAATGGVLRAFSDRESFAVAGASSEEFQNLIRKGVQDIGSVEQ